MGLDEKIWIDEVKHLHNESTISGAENGKIIKVNGWLLQRWFYATDKLFK